MESALIPGLPDDIASHCLALTPRRYHGYLQRVSRKWRAFTTSDSYFAIRRSLGVEEQWLVVLAGGRGCAHRPFRLEAFDPQLDPLPSVPSLISMHPEHVMFLWGARVVSLGGRYIYLLGGALSSDQIHTQSSTWQYDGATGQWAKRNPMLEARSDFAAVTIGSRFILVAGGWDRTRVPLSSVEVYDSLHDRWHPFIGLHRSRGGCLGIYYEGEVLVLGGLHRRTDGGNTTAVTLLCGETLQVNERQLVRLVAEREAMEKAGRRGMVAVDVYDGRRMKLVEEEGETIEVGARGGTAVDVYDSQRLGLVGYREPLREVIESGGLEGKEDVGECLSGCQLEELVGGRVALESGWDERIMACSYESQGAESLEEREAIDGKDPSATSSPPSVKQDGLALLADLFTSSCIVQDSNTADLITTSGSSRQVEEHDITAPVQIIECATAQDGTLETKSGGGDEEEEEEEAGDVSSTCDSGSASWDGPEIETSDSSTSGSLRGERRRRSIPAFDSSEESEDEDRLSTAVEIESDVTDYILGAGGSLRWEVTEGMWRQVSLPGSLVHMNGSLFCMADIASSLREFDREEKLWTEVCTMPYPQKGFQLVVLNEGLLLLGVYGGHWLIPQRRSSSGDDGFKVGRKRHTVHWAGLASLHCEAVGWTTLTL